MFVALPLQVEALKSCTGQPTQGPLINNFTFAPQFCEFIVERTLSLSNQTLGFIIYIQERIQIMLLFEWDPVKAKTNIKNFMVYLLMKQAQHLKTFSR